MPLTHLQQGQQLGSTAQNPSQHGATTALEHSTVTLTQGSHRLGIITAETGRVRPTASGNRMCKTGTAVEFSLLLLTQVPWSLSSAPE